LEAEVELLERLAGGETRRADAALAAMRFPGGVLGLQQRVRELLIAPLLLASALDELGQRAGRGRRLERAEEMGQLAGGAHAISWS
jgi:hypothetical protein